MKIPRDQQRFLLLRVARQALAARGFETDFPPAALAEARNLQPVAGRGAEARDLRSLPWCSIDNDDSRDLDQLTVAESLAGGGTRIRVAVADVSAAVVRGSALDTHAATNTTSVYTPPQNFPMLPDQLSSNLTSLVPGEDRLALVVEVLVDDGVGGASSVYPAVVRNHAKLSYPSVGMWLEGRGEEPALVSAVSGLADNLRLQDQVAQSLKARRHERGALELETIEVRAHFNGGAVSGLAAEKRSRAKELIEDFMIAANGSIVRFLEANRFPVLRRVVREPARWPRIVAIARAYGEELPSVPNAKALNDFLLKRRVADPFRFADLSLSVIKLLGRGEYIASFPDQEVSAHFGLAVSEYTHSTAPNRRYADLITQRLLKAALAMHKPSYTPEELAAIAARCTQKEDDAQKVERLVLKAAAACLLSDRIGQEFDGLVTGASLRGTWVRVLDPPVEGRVEQGQEGLDVGDRVRVRLLRTDPERGFIDFTRVGPWEPPPSSALGSTRR